MPRRGTTPVLAGLSDDEAAQFVRLLARAIANFDQLTGVTANPAV